MQHRLKQAEWNKYIANKETTMTLVCGQCDEGILTKLALGATCKADHNVGNFMNYLEQL